MSMMDMDETVSTLGLINRVCVTAVRLTRPSRSFAYCENRGPRVRPVSSLRTPTRFRPVAPSEDPGWFRVPGRNFTSPGPIAQGRSPTGVARGERSGGHGNGRRTGRPIRPGPGGGMRECPKKWNNPLTDCRCFQQTRIRAVPMA